MTAQPALDVSHLPAYTVSNRAPLWWGQIGLIAIETTMFTLLIASYFYLRLGVDVWPPPGTQFPHLLLPTIGVVILLASCVPSYLASEAAKKNDLGRMRLWMAVMIAMAIVFFILRLFEWHSWNFNWATDVHGSIMWVMMGLHTFDYIALLVESIVLLVILFTRRVGEKQRLGVHVDSYTWYFIVGIWVPMYLTMYVAPHIIQSR